MRPTPAGRRPRGRRVIVRPWSSVYTHTGRPWRRVVPRRVVTHEREPPDGYSCAGGFGPTGFARARKIDGVKKKPKTFEKKNYEKKVHINLPPFIGYFHFVVISTDFVDLVWL